MGLEPAKSDNSQRLNQLRQTGIAERGRYCKYIYIVNRLCNAHMTDDSVVLYCIVDTEKCPL